MASNINKDKDWVREELGEAQRSILAPALGATSRSMEAFLYETMLKISELTRSSPKVRRRDFMWRMYTLSQSQEH